MCLTCFCWMHWCDTALSPSAENQPPLPSLCGGGNQEKEFKVKPGYRAKMVTVIHFGNTCHVCCLLTLHIFNYYLTWNWVRGVGEAEGQRVEITQPFQFSRDHQHCLHQIT